MPRRDLAKRKEYMKAYLKRHYSNNKAAYIERAKRHNAKARTDVRAWVTSYLKEHPCVDCGEDDVIVLEFDHRPGVEKKFNFGDACNRGAAISTLKSEAEKCDVRCANCHRRITYLRAGRTSRG